MQAAKQTALSVIERSDMNMDMTLDQVMSLGEIFAASVFFADSKEAAQCVVKILAGREMGIAPLASMSGVYIIQGKPSLSANLMAAAIKRSGRYNYRILEHTNETCELEFFESGQSVGTSRFTMGDAKQAEALAGKNAHSWKKFPRNMLFARAMSNGARWFCPDIFGGPVYDPEELGAGLDTRTGEFIPTATTEALLKDVKAAPRPPQLPDSQASTPRQESADSNQTQDPLQKVRDEIKASVDILYNAGHSDFAGPREALRHRVIEHVRGIAVERSCPYPKLDSLSDLSPEHLSEYAGALEGEIELMKEERVGVAAMAEDTLP